MSADKLPEADAKTLALLRVMHERDAHLAENRMIANAMRDTMADLAITQDENQAMRGMLTDERAANAYLLAENARLRAQVAAACDWLRDALEGVGHATGIDRNADYGPKPNGVLLDDLHQWVSAVRCRHCGSIGTPGEDHTCSCPKHDNDCTEHLPWPSTTGLPWPPCGEDQ